MIRRWLRRLWPLVDWRRAAVLEARHRGAAAMLDESMRRQSMLLRWDEWAAMDAAEASRRSQVEAEEQLRASLAEPSDGEALAPRTITVDRDVLMRRAREASEGGADYLPPWTGEGL